jgi:hypothetical protein
LLDHFKLLEVIVGGVISDAAISGSRHCTKARGNKSRSFSRLRPLYQSK